MSETDKNNKSAGLDMDRVIHHYTRNLEGFEAEQMTRLIKSWDPSSHYIEDEEWDQGCIDNIFRHFYDYGRNEYEDSSSSDRWWWSRNPDTQGSLQGLIEDAECNFGWDHGYEEFGKQLTAFSYLYYHYVNTFENEWDELPEEKQDDFEIWFKSRYKAVWDDVMEHHLADEKTNSKAA